MDKSFAGISTIVRHEVSTLIYSGNKIAAIKRYREAANCDLMTAKQAVEELTGQLKNTNPALFREEPPKNIKGVAAFFAILIIGVLAAKNFPENLKNEWLEKLDGLMQTAKQKVTGSTVVTQVARPKQVIAPNGHGKDAAPDNETRHARFPLSNLPPQAGEKANEPLREFRGKQVIDHDTPYRPIAPANPESDLTTLYRQKLSNPEYIAWQNQPGIPSGYQDFIEEHHIKYARAKISGNLTLPANTDTLNIPLIPDAAITIDGAIQHQEWLRAARIKLAPAATGSILYLQADRDWLYLAADVPGDTTRDGYDQFRFYIHVDTDPAIKNERIHVSRGAPEALGGIRETRVVWQGDPPKNKDENWKKYPISDWRIYRLAKGASTMEQHRQFEAKLNLRECGLAIGLPFPVFVEVETDPIEEGKSRKRRHLGELGNQNQPVWMIMR